MPVRARAQEHAEEKKEYKKACAAVRPASMMLCRKRLLLCLGRLLLCRQRFLLYRRGLV